jgi:hypothetical protein
MPSIEDALYARLIAVTAVTSLVAQRVYPLKKDRNDNPTWPFITYATTFTSFDSPMQADSKYTSSSVRFHIWARDNPSAGTSGFDASIQIEQAIRTALQRWGGTSGGIVVDHVFIDGVADVQDPEPGVFHRIVDCDCRWFHT